MTTRGRTKQIALACALLALSACSGINLPDARNLAQAGHNSSAAMAEELEKRRAGMILWWDRDLVIQTFNNPSGEIDKDIRVRSLRVAKLISARRKMLEELSKAYIGFGNLAAYDASNEAEEGLKGFIGGANGFIAAVGEVSGAKLEPIDSAVGSALGVGFGLLAEEALKRKVKQASSILRHGLDRTAAALEKEKAIMASLDESIVKTEENVRNTLLNLGLATYQEPLDELLKAVQVPGLRSIKDPDKAINDQSAAMRGKIKSAFGKYMMTKAEDRAHVGSERYEAQIGALRDLIAEHQKLEDGQPISMARLWDMLARLQPLAAAYQDRR
ncbi:MAG: hypothetical protein HZC25_17175 [Rhodospirillales bacterium]|nr:hypothetical protein [Rhodospirillales bacterium]